MLSQGLSSGAYRESEWFAFSSQAWADQTRQTPDIYPLMYISRLSALKCSWGVFPRHLPDSQIVILRLYSGPNLRIIGHSTSQQARVAVH